MSAEAVSTLPDAAFGPFGASTIPRTWPHFALETRGFTGSRPDA
jgi:hypothetical protein